MEEPTTAAGSAENNGNVIATAVTVPMVQDEEVSVRGSHETPNDWTWLISFGAAMVPFTAFCYGHQKGMTVRVVNAVVKSPIGPMGLLLLPFCTLAMEKSIYDTVQAAQGMDPSTRPVDRGGFPSGGAELFPSFSLIPVQSRRQPSQSSTNVDTSQTTINNVSK
jgi:hypothetical protein